MPLTAGLCFWLQAKRSAFYYFRHIQVKQSFHDWGKNLRLTLDGLKFG